VNLGISVDSGRARVVLMDANGSVAARFDCTGHDVSDVIAAAARQALAGATAGRPSAVGLSFREPDSRHWPSDLGFLSAIIGEQVPVRTVSTGNASAIAESWYGSGKGVRNLIAFSIGPCASAGVISNGALLSGAHGLASSVQWLALNPVEREDYRRMGCLEAEGGAAGIVRRLVWRIKSGDRSRVLDAAGGDFNAITLDMILAGARDNDGVSISVIRDTVKYLAMAVSNIAAVVDPELIVLGGILESSSDLLLDPIRQECARRMPPGIYEHIRIELSTLGADSAPMGAARFAEFGAQLPSLKPEI
jgi:predicted NBD/HSP70 family sugar kinase